MDSVLPDFNAHSGHSKLEPLTESKEPRPEHVSLLERTTGGRDRGTVRVLDLGCGRGGIVAWLVEQGWDAHGVDVDERYVENGRALLGDRLKVSDGSTYPYPDDHFDVVLSSMVLEHVDDLEQVASELGRITKPGGRGLHIFPAKWLIREPHMQTPVAHWLPKGPARRAAIKAALRTGQAVDHFTDLALDDRAEVFYRYSVSRTFYRRPVAIRRIFRGAGLETDMQSVAVERLARVLGRDLPRPASDVAAWLYRSSRVMYVSTTKVGRPRQHQEYVRVFKRGDEEPRSR